MLTGKTVVLGISGGIAAYKIANLASMLKKQNANVHVIMTENAQKFITTHTFEALTHNRTITGTFDRNHSYDVEHVELAKKADIFMVAPATANVIGKMANGIADDMLTTTLLAAKCKIMVAPAMNTGMYENPIVQDNIKKLEGYGMKVILPASGYLACGDVGAGKMPEPEALMQHILNEIAFEKDMEGKNVLITAGATKEAVDPVRFLTNHSTGKMGYAIAKACHMRGANVTLVSGQTTIEKPLGVKVIDVVSAKEMFDAVMENICEDQIIIKTAAVADYRPTNVSTEKVKKKSGNLEIPLEKTDDILMTLGHNRKAGQFICGFSMETENLINNSREKLERKNIDMVVANSLRDKGAGFGTDTNAVTLITEEIEVELPLLTKDEVAHEILNMILGQAEV